MKKTITTLIGITALLAMASVTQAKLAGKNVVLVHGFRSTDLRDHPTTSQLKSLANQYWSAYWGSRAESIIYWGSDGRISGTIKDQVKAQFKALESAGTCANGCVIVTHSTGDLVTRYALKKLGQWGISTSRFKVLAVLDFAGAGGGTEIADTAVGVSEGSGWVNSAMKSAVNLFMGFTPTAGQMGVLYDLQPANARNLATGSNSYPRLRFAGTGWQYAGVTKPFISGADDSVVPLHSACGAASAGAYDSCSRSIQPNGVITSVSKAPSSLWYNHYAVLMGEKTNHGAAINTTSGNEYATVSNNFSRNGITVDFATKTERKWWSWGKKVRWVKNGSSKSMSANVYDTLNN
ncbi:MAG: hypothetical protein D6758_11490 [Gammaproteobacteria bacterium]|nr:MAG: hypothetical protein D6758_11490 [Gammaproteobacteria bacterium]